MSRRGDSRIAQNLQLRLTQQPWLHQASSLARIHRPQRTAKRSNLRNRYYNPALGIFTQQDPVQGIVGGSASMYWNPYGYVGGNPTNFTDPSGECVLLCLAAAVLIGGGIGLGIGSELVFNQDRCYNGCERTLTDQWSAGEALDVFEAGATGAFAGASATLALSTAYSYPIATLLYAGGYHAYNKADTGGANSFNLLGVLSGYDFVQSGFDTLRNDPNPVSKLGGFGNVALNIGLGGALFHGIGEASKTAILASRLSMSNTSWRERGSRIGSLGFNLGFGASQFSGIGHAYQSTRLASRLKGVDNAQDRLGIIRQFTSEMVGSRVHVELSGNVEAFYRPLHTRTILINPNRITSNRFYLSGNVVHESMHILQEWRYGNRAMMNLLHWADRSGDVRTAINPVNPVFGYFFNQAEIAARTSGLLSLSTNTFFDLGTRGIGQSYLYYGD